MFLRSTDLGFASHVMFDGYWESWLTQFLAQRLQPGMTVIDVGANFGYYSLLFSDAVGPRGRVLAIEPVPDTASLLGDSLELNGFWNTAAVHKCAVGADAGATIRLFVPAREPKNASILKNDALAQNEIEVPSTTLDALLKDLPRVDLIKIDADGSEQAIIDGMPETLQKHRPSMVLEYNATRCTDPGRVVAALLSTYGRARYIGFDGHLHEVSREALCDKRHLDDWLLYFN
jgi:FkbM family methyltransferase